MARWLGDTTGARPVKFYRGSKWQDVLTPQIDRHSPIIRFGLLFRVWLDNAEQAKRLEAELPAFLASRSTSMRCEWLDLRPEVDLLQLQLEIEEVAESLGLVARTDSDVIALLRSCEKENVAS